ncbi:hypothetical protein CF54_37815 [Streptomyces sp. Tu 6176]|nr:hypothetical protein CF54_37815 [Streptomyces sp. Tu 6176]
MTDEVGLGRSGGGEHLVDVGGQLPGRPVDGAEAVEDRDARQLAVVEREDAVPAGRQIGRETEPVVDGVAEGAVDEDDGAGVGRGRLAAVVVPARAGGGGGVGRGGRDESDGGGQEQGGQVSAGALEGQHRVISLRLKGGATALRPVIRITRMLFTRQVTDE